MAANQDVEQSTEYYDVIIIGAGAAGSTCAHGLKDHGYRIAQIERDRIGGTCLNYGCDPTKTLLHIGQMLTYAEQATAYGVRLATGRPDWGAIQQRVREVIDGMRGGSSAEAAESLRAEGIEVIFGEATFKSAREIAVGDKVLTADHIVVATGTRATVPSVPGLQESGFVTNQEVIYFEELPARLAVIGGGPVGVEFAQLFARFGVEVMLFEQAPHILGHDDRELADLLAEQLRAEGITIFVNAELTEVARGEQGKRLTIEHDGQMEHHECDELLIALGRTPNIEALQLERAGIDVQAGQIAVTAALCTSVPHIWAAGDVANNYPFTHVAEAQGELIAQNIRRQQTQPFDDSIIPWVTYTEPALAHVGKTVAQLDAEGVTYRLATASIKDNPRAQTMGLDVGKVKLLIGEDDRILGGQILAHAAGELLAPIVVAMHGGLSAQALGQVILPYPTLAQTVITAVSK